MDALVKEALTIAPISRFEVHGPAAELDMLRKPLAGLNQQWFIHIKGTTMDFLGIWSTHVSAFLLTIAVGTTLVFGLPIAFRRQVRDMTRPISLAISIYAIALALTGTAPVAAGGTVDWPVHGHDLGAQRYVALDQIRPDNVARLAPAWTWHSGVLATFESTPIVVDGVMYLSLPFSHVVALDGLRRT